MGLPEDASAGSGKGLLVWPLAARGFPQSLVGPDSCFPAGESRRSLPGSVVRCYL